MKSPEERLAAFRLLCLSVHREKAILSNEEAKKFFLYWTERSPSGKKHRWEFEKTFDIARRMGYWSSNVRPERHRREEPTSPRG